jgi:hypothetical protein
MEKWEQNRTSREMYQCSYTHTKELEISIKNPSILDGVTTLILYTSMMNLPSMHRIYVIQRNVLVCFSCSVTRCRSLLF